MAEFTSLSIQVNVERARAYVLAHGGSREQARLAGILEGARPEKDVVKELEQLQNPDGGFPFRQQPGGPSSIDTTCYLLAQLKDLPPLAGSPMATRAVSYLRRAQEVDGSWREELGATWTAGEAGAAYLTANALYTILTLDPDHTDPILRGERWLRAELEGRGYEADPQTMALAMGLGFRLGGPAQLRMADECRDRFVADAGRSAAEVAWFLSCALEGRVGGRAIITLIRLLAWLAAQQQEDGSWPSEAGFATESTLTALRVFKGYGLI